MRELSSLTRDQTCAHCAGRRSLNPWTTREVLLLNTSTWLNGEVEACRSGVTGGKMWGGRLRHRDVGWSLSHLWDPSDFLVGTLRGCLSTFRRSPSPPSPPSPFSAVSSTALITHDTTYFLSTLEPCLGWGLHEGRCPLLHLVGKRWGKRYCLQVCLV